MAAGRVSTVTRCAVMSFEAGLGLATDGTPQSLGRVELAYSSAQTAYGLMDYGTLVTVTSQRVGDAKTAGRRAVATGRPSRSRVSGEQLADPLVALLHLADQLLNEIADLVCQHADVAVLGA